MCFLHTHPCITHISETIVQCILFTLFLNTFFLHVSVFACLLLLLQESPLVTEDHPTPMSTEEALRNKDIIIEFAEAYSPELAAERFGVPRNTVRSWLKQRKLPTKPMYNSPGQGRKISYSRELDIQIADHVRMQLDKDERVTVQDVCSYARKLIQQENPDFTASTGWAQRFLTRNNIDLSAQVKKLIPTTRQGNLSSSVSPDNRGRPLSYSADTDNLIAEWVREKTERGESITNSELRKHAKEIISKENPNFTGSASWAQNFLLRHRLCLHPTYFTSHTDRLKPESLSTSSPSTDSHSVPSLQLISSQIVCEGQSQNITVSTTPLQSTLSSTPANESLATSSATYTSVDDGVTSTLALLAGENIQVEGNLSQAQATALTLSDLTSDPTLAEILGASQDPATANISGFSQATLDTPVSQLTYLNSLGHQLSELVVPTVGGGTSLVSSTVNSPQTTMQSVLNHHDMEVLGSGTRPLSYAKETDQALANWVKDQQAAGYKVTFASLRAYAKKLVSSENPNFNASVGWVTPFLLRHNLDLKINDRRSRSTRKTTNPRKLQSKGEEHEDVDVNGDIPTDEQPAMEDREGELEIQPLAIIPPLSSQLSEHHVISAPDESGNAQTLDTNGDHQKKEELLPVPQSQSKKPKVGNRARHTLAEKLEVVRLMRQYNVAGHYVSKLLGIANSTLSGWIKLVDEKGSELEALSANKKRSNRSGQGRPLTYSKEKDEIIALWVRQQQEMGVALTAADLTSYATNVIREENQNFIASVGWRHKFLQRHNLQLVKNDKSQPQEDLQNIPLPVQTEEVCTDEYTPEIVEKVYPEELTAQLADWGRRKVSEVGSLSIQAFCKKAEEMILPIDPMFVATLGWAFKFLHRHGLMLDPKPTTLEVNRKRPMPATPTVSGGETAETPTPKKPNATAAIVAAAIGLSPGMTVSPSTGNLCEALLSLSSQGEQIGISSDSPLDTSTTALTIATPTTQLSSTKSYFGKPAREFSSEEKEEVVRYANATTLQKAAIKYGVAAPTVWRWRMELKLHQPKYTANQKKYIVKFAETNSLKDAATRFGITTKTVQNWKKALQLDGTLSDVEIAAIPPPPIQELQSDNENLTTPSNVNGGLITEEVIPLDNSHFQYIVDGGEVAEGTRVQQMAETDVPSSSLEVTHEIQVQDVGMEYDVISSEGHAAKPRCTQEEKAHILQFALDHSIKEASVKYGVSPGTLYYWKKNHLSTQNKNTTSPIIKSKAPGESEESFPSASGTNLETTVVNVSVPVDIMSSAGMIQTTTTGDPLQSFSITDAGMLAETHGSMPTSNLINAITQTLASATPEQLQSLQQITSDFSLLQAVTSLLSSQEGANSLRHVLPSEGTSRLEGNGGNGGISSPTEVLVSFNPSNSSSDVPATSVTVPPNQNDLQVQLQVSTEMPITIEEVTTSQTTAMATDEPVEDALPRETPVGTEVQD